MHKIIQELKKVILSANLGVNNRRLRCLINPQLFELAITATQKTGDIKWISMLLEKAFVRENEGQDTCPICSGGVV